MKITDGVVPALLVRVGGVAKRHTRTRFHRGLLPDTCCIERVGRAAILTPDVQQAKRCKRPGTVPSEDAQARFGVWGSALGLRARRQCSFDGDEHS